MNATEPCVVEVFVDPSCPYAWITAQWLTELEHHGVVALTTRLLSLSVVNEHREIDAWYRQFNDAAWGPARVMAAVENAHGNPAARRFYEAFGQRFHVEHGTADEADRNALAAQALDDTDLPACLIDAATDCRLDEQLRVVTTTSLEPVGLDVGVPIIRLDGVAASGPVLSKIPRGTEAVALLDSIRTLATHDGFIRFERQRIGPLHPS